MAGFESLLREQETIIALLSQEKSEDVASATDLTKQLDTINTRLHSLETHEAAIIAEHAGKQAGNMKKANVLLKQIDERNADPFADFLDGLNYLFNPNQTRGAWKAEAKDVARRMELDAAALEAERARTAERRLLLNDAVRQAKAQHSFELGETAAVEVEQQRVDALIELEKSRRAFAADEHRRIEQLLEKTGAEDITEEFKRVNNITDEQVRLMLERKQMSRIALETNRRQLQRIREADTLDSIPDIFAISYEDAEKLGVRRAVLDDERRKQRQANLALAAGEMSMRAGMRAEHEDAKKTFLESLGPRDLHRLIEEVKADPGTSVAQVGPFSITLEELLTEFNNDEKFFAEQAATETAFALSQGGVRESIGTLARIAGGNAPAEMTNLTGLEYLNNTQSVPEEYRPIIEVFTEAHKRYENLPAERKESRMPAMVMRNNEFGKAVGRYVERVVASLPEAVQPAAADFYTTGKIENPESAEALLKTYVLDRQRYTSDPVISFVLQDLHQRSESFEIPRYGAEGLTTDERRELQLKNVLANPSHVSQLVDAAIHTVSHVTHVELANQLGLKNMAADLASTDPNNELHESDGSFNVARFHERIKLYLQESEKDISLAQYEDAYVKLATKKLLESFTPSGDGNLQTAALNTALFDNNPQAVLRHAVVTRLAMLDKIAQTAGKDRQTMIDNMLLVQKRMEQNQARVRTRMHQFENRFPMMSDLPSLGGNDMFRGLSGAEVMSVLDELDDPEYQVSVQLGLGEQAAP